ncbi:MAG: TlyA family RNA methyltransferase [Merismopedia sp. SIO2A8]|nr:TlyA family RNA methyltransferase [Merismopedia sp. SIO2A8]
MAKHPAKHSAKHSAKQRLDALLVEQQLCSSRQQAQRLIRAGEVFVNQQRVDKPGTPIHITAEIVVKQRSPFVSRGGEKLQRALTEFGVQVQDRICLDGGISTGGFTDCLLQAGAKQVYGVDVGYGQVAWKLRQNPNVILKERTNIRHLSPEELYEDGNPDANLGVVDVSFISLAKVLPALWDLLCSPREVVLLVKPQFEVGRERVGKGGVVRDSKDHADAVATVLDAAHETGWQYLDLTWSPLVGPAGNIEYLLWLSMESDRPFPAPSNLQALTAAAKEALAST